MNTLSPLIKIVGFLLAAGQPANQAFKPGGADLGAGLEFQSTDERATQKVWVVMAGEDKFDGRIAAEQGSNQFRLLLRLGFALGFV